VPEEPETITCADAGEWERWLAAHHGRQEGVWLKMANKRSGFPSVTSDEAVDVGLCYGWISSHRTSLDESWYLQRYTPRRPRSNWSRVNVAKVEALIAAGRMRPPGLAEVEAAKADGRWDRAYASGKDMRIPDDLQAAIDAEPAAKAMLAKLTAQNRFALAFRVHNMKTEAGRKRKIETFVAMLKRGETIYPQAMKSP
jgi:uncharacterized protein YdeI (YjbR/CyaY-like superfamily)